MASEVIEHVKQPGQFLSDLATAAAPGGQVFITTLNRTPAAYGLAIVAAEYLLRFVPPGTHDWHKFITPQVGCALVALALYVLRKGSLVEYRVHEQQPLTSHLHDTYCCADKSA
jgi:2-polyprenyl-6-hydroxyphenyl methylase/3-demethylubiquinone-9 3-methyltransferase